MDHLKCDQCGADLQAAMESHKGPVRLRYALWEFAGRAVYLCQECDRKEQRRQAEGREE